MTVDLRERLSEFSYGYAVTREVEKLLEAIGLRATPFLPSLVDEAAKGFDVKFDRPGKPLLLQFKLGEELRRFRRQNPTDRIPSPLQRPFWRFKVDTSEPQFLLLNDASQAQAEVYYIAPRFSRWEEFDHAFQAGRILDRSLIVRPADIHTRTQGQGPIHRVIYDHNNRYICSEPQPLPEMRPEELSERIGSSIRLTRRSLASSVAGLIAGSGRTQGPSAYKIDCFNSALDPVERKARFRRPLWVLRPGHMEPN